MQKGFCWSNFMRVSRPVYGVSGKFSCRNYLTPFLVILYFSPHVILLVSLLGYKGCKGIIWKEDKKRSYEAKISFIFWLYFWVPQPFSRWGNYSWTQMKRLRHPVKVLKCISRFCANMFIIRSFQLSLISPLYGVLVVILMSPLF